MFYVADEYPESGWKTPSRLDGHASSVYLEVDVDRALDRLAEQQGVTKAEVIRSALRNATSNLERRRIQAIGIAHGPGDVAGDVDRHLQ